MRFEANSWLGPILETFWAHGALDDYASHDLSRKAFLNGFLDPDLPEIMLIKAQAIYRRQMLIVATTYCEVILKDWFEVVQVSKQKKFKVPQALKKRLDLIEEIVGKPFPSDIRKQLEQQMEFRNIVVHEAADVVIIEEHINGFQTALLNLLRTLVRFCIEIGVEVDEKPAPTADGNWLGLPYEDTK